MKLTDPAIVSALNAGGYASLPIHGGVSPKIGLYIPKNYSTLSGRVFFVVVGDKKYPTTLEAEAILSNDWFIVGQEPTKSAAPAEAAPKKTAKKPAKKAVAKKK